MAAAGQPEIVAADPQPAVPGGVGEHLAEELAVGPLEGVAPDQRASRLGNTVGERVADLLELTQVEDPRQPGGGHPVRDGDAPEALGDQPAELTLELRDLAAQLGAGQSLVDRDSLEHSPHEQILSRLEGGRGNP